MTPRPFNRGFREVTDIQTIAVFLHRLVGFGMNKNVRIYF